MRVLIIEDEDLAAERLEKLLLEIDHDILVLNKLGSIKDSVKWLSTNTADLIFLDIQLSDGISFSIFEQIQINIPVIFTTAYDEYAIKAFKLNSISYLLKPVRKIDLEESLHKYRSLKASFNTDYTDLLAAIRGEQMEYRKRFLIQAGDKFRKVESSEIAYFFALEKNVFMKTFEGNTYPSEMSLDNLENILDPSIFFRINRKYIVNVKSISNMYSWSRSRIKLILKPDPDDETVVSIDRSGNFKKWLNK
jgi:DNA-binding LytR/AlgR family response regulator